METVRTAFAAPMHGFRFVNSFDLSDTLIPRSLRKKQPFLALSDVVFGLCGGMCFAALDYFYVSRPVPAFTAVDEISLQLLDYLWERQWDSLRGGALAKVLTWTLRADNSLARSIAGWEIPKLRNNLSSGAPSVLALIRVGGIAEVMENHQVLATGYDFDPDTQQMTLHLYDPNYPGEEPTMSMNLANPSQGIELAQSSGEALRGFFVIDYARQTPPSLS
jgi:hypothetical protein